MKTGLFVLGVFAVVALGCDEASVPGEENSRGQVDNAQVDRGKVDPAVVKAVNALALRRIAAAEEDNAVVFPTTEAQSLAIMRSGAGEGTSTERELEALFPECSARELNASVAHAAGRDVVDRYAVFSRAAVEGDFFAEYEECFGALYDDPRESAQVINQVLNEEVVNPSDIDPRTMLMIVSRSRLSGRWDEPFDKNETRPDRDSGIQVMRKERGKEKVGSVQGLSNRVLILRAGPMTAYFVDVKDRAEADAVVEVLATQGLNAVTVDPKSRVTVIGVPRFEMDHNVDLIETYTKLGVNAPFGAAADFSRMLGETDGQQVFVAQFTVATKMKVHETGFEGEATATASVWGRGFDTELCVDRCVFMFVNEHGTIVSVGRYITK